MKTLGSKSQQLWDTHKKANKTLFDCLHVLSIMAFWWRKIWNLWWSNYVSIFFKHAEIRSSVSSVLWVFVEMLCKCFGMPSMICFCPCWIWQQSHANPNYLLLHSIDRIGEQIYVEWWIFVRTLPSWKLLEFWRILFKCFLGLR